MHEAEEGAGDEQSFEDSGVRRYPRVIQCKTPHYYSKWYHRVVVHHDKRMKIIQAIARSGQKISRASIQLLPRPYNKKEGELSSRCSLWKNI